MAVSETPVIERVARVLAGAAHSKNADGNQASASEEVDAVWHDHLNQALAVLRTMREPDQAMVAVGDEDAWSRMIDVALKKYSFEDGESLGGSFLVD
jgi:hypothetical protein